MELGYKFIFDLYPIFHNEGKRGTENKIASGRETEGK